MYDFRGMEETPECMEEKSQSRERAAGSVELGSKPVEYIVNLREIAQARGVVS
jgi:hypothetical protein